MFAVAERVLGVDPGLVRTGWAVIDSDGRRATVVAHGVIAPPPNCELPARLAAGATALRGVLRQYQPRLAALEEVFTAPRHPRSALLMAHMRGVICLLLEEAGLPILPLTATTVKQRLTGNGHASKKQVQSMVEHVTGLGGSETIMRLDESDALALALAALGVTNRPAMGTRRPARGLPEHLLARAWRPVYSYLRGTYKGRAGDEAVVIEVGGIGYEVFLPPIVDGELSASVRPDSDLLLYVSAQAGRDQPWPVLFGFLRPEEKAFWELLKSVPRIGGRGAARAMAVPIEQIAAAIQDGNRAFLDGLPGITLDGAEKMIASLRKKVGPFVQAAPRVSPRQRAGEEDIRGDAILLLVQMGLKRPDAQRAVDQLLATRDDIISVQDVVTEYLRGRQRAASAV